MVIVIVICRLKPVGASVVLVLVAPLPHIALPMDALSEPPANADAAAAEADAAADDYENMKESLEEESGESDNDDTPDDKPIMIEKVYAISGGGLKGKKWYVSPIEIDGRLFVKLNRDSQP